MTHTHNTYVYMRSDLTASALYCTYIQNWNTTNQRFSNFTHTHTQRTVSHCERFFPHCMLSALFPPFSGTLPFLLPSQFRCRCRWLFLFPRIFRIASLFPRLLSSLSYPLLLLLFLSFVVFLISVFFSALATYWPFATATQASVRVQSTCRH